MFGIFLKLLSTGLSLSHVPRWAGGGFGSNPATGIPVLYNAPVSTACSVFEQLTLSGN